MDNNSADFVVGVPNPRNSASPTQACGTGPTGNGSADPSTVAPQASEFIIDQLRTNGTVR